MPPKKKVTKGEEKKKAKIVEDKTFGLKNKNRSAQVQKFVQSTQKQTMGDIMARKSALTAEKSAKKEAKAAKEAELKALGLAKEKDPKEKKDGTDPQFKSSAEHEDYLWTAEDFEYEADETTLEEQLQKELEQLREDFASGKKKGTPVTPETFAIWEDKRRKEAEKAARRAQAAFRKTGGGMSGRALFDFDASLFKDDEGAAEEYQFDDEEDEDAEDDDEEDEDADDEDEDAEDADEAPGPAEAGASAAAAEEG